MTQQLDSESLRICESLSERIVKNEVRPQDSLSIGHWFVMLVEAAKSNNSQRSTDGEDKKNTE